MTGAAREASIAAFLRANGFAPEDAQPLAQDASFRRYLRLKGGAVLMDAPPPEDTRPFLRIAAHLAALGLSVPRILAADAVAGLVIEEDLGDDLFSAILSDTNIGTLFDAAVDALIVFQRAAPPPDLPPWVQHQVPVQVGVLEERRVDEERERGEEREGEVGLG